jgi:hypothetical protein
LLHTQHCGFGSATAHGSFGIWLITGAYRMPNSPIRSHNCLTRFRRWTRITDRLPLAAAFRTLRAAHVALPAPQGMTRTTRFLPFRHSADTMSRASVWYFRSSITATA